MTPRRALTAVVLAALAAGCVPLSPPPPWDPDGPVLPLRPQADETRAAGPEPTSKESLPASYVILLPDDDGETGSIVLDRPEGRVVLSEPGMISLDGLTVPTQTVPAELTAALDEALDSEPRAPARFHVFFDSGEVDPVPDSRRRLEEALEALSDWPAAEIRLSGHSDRSGSATRNDELSRRRAEAIRDALVAGGAAAHLVEVTWHGEEQNAVPTADGVREPRNRRVEIRIR